MKFYKYAVRVEREASDPQGGAWHHTLIGVSNESEADARRNGEERLAKLPPPHMMRERGRLQPDHYLQYGDRPVVEEVLKELRNERQQLAGILTRNHYGSVVLNAAQVPFFDVDDADEISSPAVPAKPGLLNWLYGKLGGSTDASNIQPSQLSALQAKLQTYSDLIFRVYRTAAGYRIMLLNRLLEPHDTLTQMLFDDLGCDPLYRKFCGSQECYRARLTPKPWRCGMIAPSSKHPRGSSWSQQSFQLWLNRYEATIRDLAVCRWIGDIGGNYDVHDLPNETQLLLSIHDAFTLRDGPRDLA